MTFLGWILKIYIDCIIIGNKRICKRKFDPTTDIEEHREYGIKHCERNIEEHKNIERTNQSELQVEAGM